ncbi:MAG TPA: hypothetical protein VN622_02490 [Clostridia bacterium]|nr:hypothetical protein [Clostridia bacterium]
MILTIDNFDMVGPRDYTEMLDAQRPANIVRKLNEPARLEAWLVAQGVNFRTPVNGARVVIERRDGVRIFTGHVEAMPEHECLGEGERGPVFRYALKATGDEYLLDRKPVRNRAPFVNRAAGEVLAEMANELSPLLDTSGIQAVEQVASYASDPRRKWSAQAAELARYTRSYYRVHDGRAEFAPLGGVGHLLDEQEAGFTPERLKVRRLPRLLNDVTIVGRVEPRAYVKDYFLGDGYTLRFGMSQSPFSRRNMTVVEEEYAGGALRPEYWSMVDPSEAVSVAGGKLHVSGGAGDGATTVRFVEQVELGGAAILQHGDVTFAAPSAGLLGGLYGASVTKANCVAGFEAMKSGAQTQLQAVVNGVAIGPVVTAVAGHRYSLTTRFYSSEVYRREQRFHSSVHAAGNGRGGASVKADLRVVLEVRDVDPQNPATLAAAATVVYDGVLADVLPSATYAVVNSTDLHCELTYTRMRRAVDAQVRSCEPGKPAHTRLVSALSEGGECSVSSEPALYFYAANPPLPNETIMVSYRGAGRAMARVTDPTSVSEHARQHDDGVRGAVLDLMLPPPRTAADCEKAGFAVLDDRTQPAWAGEYETWSDWLPGTASDIFPGEALQVRAPSRKAEFEAIVREVEIQMADPADDRSRYKLVFANDAAEELSFKIDRDALREPLDVAATTESTQAGFLECLPNAEVTEITSTTLTIDAGLTPTAAGGIEVRRSDTSWEAENDRNLAGRFTTRSFTLPRLSRVQEYYLRLFDGSTPRRYSRYSTVLHVDYPL